MDTLTAQLQNLPPESSSDIFSLSDQVLSERLEFIEEVRRCKSLSRDAVVLIYLVIADWLWQLG